MKDASIVSCDNALAESFNDLYKTTIPPAELEANYYRQVHTTEPLVSQTTESL